jgi:hypothetical protein
MKEIIREVLKKVEDQPTENMEDMEGIIINLEDLIKEGKAKMKKDLVK